MGGCEGKGKKESECGESRGVLANVSRQLACYLSMEVSWRKALRLCRRAVIEEGNSGF